MQWKTFIEIGFCRHKNDVDDQFAVETRVPNFVRFKCATSDNDQSVSVRIYCVQFTVYIISKVYLRAVYCNFLLSLASIPFCVVFRLVWLKSFFFFTCYILSSTAHLHGIMK